MKIKICGLTNIDDALCAVEHGADLLGFVFYKPSPRAVSPEQAKKIIKALPIEAIKVGVFVNESIENMLNISNFCSLNILQLHGTESVEKIQKLKQISVIKAFSLKKEDDLERLSCFSNYRILIDTPSKSFGGTGLVGNWSLAKKVASQYQIFLAGGLTPQNVADAIKAVNPYGVDVSSGVEKEKGIKDKAKVQAFINEARTVNTNRTAKECQ